MRRVLIFLVIIPLFAGLRPAAAQDDSASCEPLIEQAVSTILDSCYSMENGTACAGSGAVTIETTDGQTVSQPGGIVPLATVKSITAAGDGSAWSIAQLHLTDKVNRKDFATLLLLGPAVMILEADEDLPAGSVFSLTGDADPAPCGDLARPGVLIQAPLNSLTLLRVNGIDLAVNGTAVIQSTDGKGLTISAITRETILGQSGTVVFAGYAMQVNGDPNAQVTPFDPANVAHLPTAILPVMELVPLPGSGSVIEETVLHLRPDASSYTGTKVKVLVPVSLFGQDPSGQWIYIRTYDGETGWVPASTLGLDVASDLPVLEEGLAALQRPLRPFGDVQARGVTTAESNNLRDGPGQNYNIVAAVPLGSELAIYARSPENEWFLVETADGVRAWISVTIVSPTTPLTIEDLPYSPDFPG
jgi:hypothetical protein